MRTVLRMITNENTKSHKRNAETNKTTAWNKWLTQGNATYVEPKRYTTHTYRMYNINIKNFKTPWYWISQCTVLSGLSKHRVRKVKFLNMQIFSADATEADRRFQSEITRTGKQWARTLQEDQDKVSGWPRVPRLCRNGWTDWAGFRHRGYRRLILH